MNTKEKVIRVLLIVAALALIVWLVIYVAQGANGQPVEYRPSRQQPTAQVADSLSPQAITVTYSRDLYRHWLDADQDCQDTRVEILIDYGIEELSEDGCKVVSVQMVDPYTLEFYAGPARALDIDHIVPLAEAHRSGADKWDAERRAAFANDALNLLPTVAKWNRQKGDRDPTDWRPPAELAWCEYGQRWVTVKQKWELSMDQAEQAAIGQLVDRCPWREEIARMETER